VALWSRVDWCEACVANAICEHILVHRLGLPPRDYIAGQVIRRRAGGACHPRPLDALRARRHRSCRYLVHCLFESRLHRPLPSTQIRRRPGGLFPPRTLAIITVTRRRGKPSPASLLLCPVAARWRNPAGTRPLPGNMNRVIASVGNSRWRPIAAGDGRARALAPSLRGANVHIDACGTASRAQ